MTFIACPKVRLSRLDMPRSVGLLIRVVSYRTVILLRLATLYSVRLWQCVHECNSLVNTPSRVLLCI